MKCCPPIYPLLLLPSLFSLLSFNAHGDVNKWVDDNNQTHYSDQPAPANVKATPLNIPAASASGVPVQKTIAEREADYRKVQKVKEEEGKKEAKMQEDARAKQKYCEDARSSLKTLENIPRISTYDSKGERSYLDDAARNQRIEEARKGISDNCN